MKGHYHILVVDDDALMRRSVVFHLEQAGYSASAAISGEDALASAAINPPDLVLMDIGLPGMDGLDALRRFKERWNVPVIFVTARRRELDEMLGLELGADDYITKPFDVGVLLARIKAVLRRAEKPDSGETAEPQALHVGGLSIHPAQHMVTINTRQIDLTPREFDLLYALMLHPAQVQSPDVLLAGVWGAEFAGQPQVVYVHVRGLREKIEADPNHPQRLITVRGVGYKLVAPAGESPQ